MRLSCPLLVLSLLVPALSARADDVQVPFDAAGRVERLDATSAGTAGLLREYPGLEEARLYQDTDSGAFTLEVTERREERSVRRRVAMTAAQVEALRQQVTERLAAAPAAPAVPAVPAVPAPAVTPAAPAAPVATAAPGGLNQEGRWLLIGTSAVMGAGFYGWAIPMGLRVNTSGTGVGLYMLTTGASFFAPLLLTANQDVTWGMTAMYYAGGTRGPVHGLLLSALFADTNVQPESFLLGAAVGVAEAVGGAAWASATGMSAGTAHTLMTASDFGLGYGLGLWALATGNMPMANFRAPAASMLLGAAGGAVGGYYLAKARGYTWGEAEAIRTAGLLGAYLTTPILAFTEVRDVRAMAGLLLTGSSLGLVLGDALVHGRGYGVGPALLLDLGTVAGGLVALGSAYVIAPQGFSTKAALTSSALGAAAGFMATWALLGAMPSSPQHASAPAVHLQVDPLALMAPQHQDGRPQDRTPPVVSMLGRF